MKDNQYKKAIYLYGINFLLLLIFWGGLLRYNFNSDTIFHMVVDDADAMSRIEAGRYIVGLGDWLLFKCGIRTTTNVSLTMLVAFIIFALVMTKLYDLFREWCPKDKIGSIGYFIAIELVFLNVLFSELLMFDEFSAFFALGYLFAVIGVEKLVKHRYISALCYLALAVSTYQYTVVFAAVLATVHICLTHKAQLSLKAVKEEIIAIVCCMGMGGLNYLSIIVLKKLGVIAEFGKHPGMGDIGEKIEDAVYSFLELNRSSAGIFPDLWIPLLFMFGVFGIIVYSCIKRKEISKIIYIFIVWIGSNLLLYVIPFVQEEFYFPPRMSFCFYLVQGSLLLMAYYVSFAKQQELLTCACVMYLVIQLLFGHFIVSNRFVSNTLDEVYTNMMYQEVVKYENETGTQVTKLAVVHDAFSQNYYEEVEYASYQINERTLGTSTNSLLWVVTGRHFENVEMDEEIYKEYFEGKDWDYFDLSQQLVIRDGVAYWCIF